MTQYVGIDLSLTNTGLAIYDFDGGAPRTMCIKSKAPKPGYPEKLGRFETISGHILGSIASSGARVFLEGPSYGSAGAATHDIAGNWWILYGALTGNGIPVMVIAPSVVKMYATGKGNAAKDAVMAAAIKRYPDVDIPGNDIADAVILLAIGMRHAGHPLEDSLPAANLRALNKLVAA